MTTETLDLISIGRLACDVQASIPRVREALAELNIEPPLIINNIHHYPADTADRLFPLLRK